MKFSEEQRLDDALNYAESIIQTVREPLLVLGGDLRVQTVNRSFCRAFHVSPEEATGRLLYDLGNGQWDVPELRRLLSEILPQNSHFDDFDVEHEFPQIGRRVMKLNARRIRLQGESTERILLAIEDVTERNRAVEERREIETRFASLVKNIRDHSIFTLDPAGHITSWNREAENIIGYSEQEAIGQHFSLIFTPQDVEQGVPQQELDTALELGRAEDERWHRRKDGKLFWAFGIVTPTMGADETHSGYSKILRDMTDRKRIQEQLRDAQSRLDSALTAGEIGTWIWDVDNDRLLPDHSLAVMLGLSPEKADGVKMQEFMQAIHPDDVSEVQHAIEQSLEAGTTYEVDFRLGDSGESVRSMTARGRVERDDAGRAVRLSGVMMDVTRRVESERKLTRLAADLSEADRRKTEFLAALGHELRNPLAPIRTGLEILKRLEDDPTKIEETRLMMEGQVQQMVRLIDDLLDISRITRGILTLRTRRTTLSEVVQSAMEASRPLIDEVGHHLSVTLPPKEIRLDADPNRLVQVLSNLLSNSAKYTPAEGHIWLSVEREDDDAVIKVRDDGIGVPAEIQNDIFELFNQSERDLEHGHTGLGIGLTLVKQLVEMHGGSVEVHSEGRGAGSEFIVRLPIVDESRTSDRPATEDDTAAEAGGLRVLLVDDNKAAVDMLGMVVKMLGNEVRTANDGQQAIEIAAEFLPDVVLMDIGMPHMNGYEAACHIRQQRWGARMVLVALTGWGQDEDRQRSKEAGFDHHLVKPAEPAAVQKLLAVAARAE